MYAEDCPEHVQGIHSVPMWGDHKFRCIYIHTFIRRLSTSPSQILNNISKLCTSEDETQFCNLCPLTDKNVCEIVFHTEGKRDWVNHMRDVLWER